MSEILPILNTILSKLNNIESQLASNGTPTSPSSGDSPSSTPSMRAFDSYLQERLEPFVNACTKLGGDAEKAGALIKDSWYELKMIIAIAAVCTEPPAPALPELLAKISTNVKALSSLVTRNEWEKHMKTCSEGVGCLNWVVVKPAPMEFIENFIGGSDYWANGIRKEYKSSNPDHIAFCDTFKALIVNLVTYVKDFHRTGLSWNPKGIPMAEYKADATTKVEAKSSEPTTMKASQNAAPPKAALFADLNKDAAITSGLKKVTKDMQTWRAEYKAEGTVPPKVTAPVKANATAAANQVKGPPKFEYQDGGSKWVIENQSDASGPVNVEIKDKKETVYIFGCVGATIKIKNKCKSIVVDNCKKTVIYFDSAMASCEVVNCQRMQVHVLEYVASVAIDKTDGIVVYLAKTSLETNIVASKSSEMNLSWPDGEDNWIEKPIPEQYVHRVVNNAITADVSDLYGH